MTHRIAPLILAAKQARISCDHSAIGDLQRGPLRLVVFALRRARYHPHLIPHLPISHLVAAAMIASAIWLKRKAATP